ncbi:Rpn family recombination-promoting nuclease/putative transposase [Ruminococcus albus]|uniref:Transposase (putative) YhgA-like domain-containing protein n=1 Tax=Ruminococcus albus 8 TaxID=246199 RepID=E9SAC8_RUMAL|nr:Rpn family recombination-promoting nuclease/putative transposase [Ruminococcus albus]EGC03761.1 hypothetical protein CUS_4370 [Ruminococcus albus 8]MCC3351786.1 Rpn family recombination-promoting nuclease/putative transposase [Ruminococcus albus 8]
MSKIDTPTKKFMNDNNNAADIINFMLYDGKQIIDPDELVSVDPTMIFTNDKENRDSDDDTQRIRDVYKKLAMCKSDGERIYAMIGIENQTKVHYAMPVRCAVYDALSYLKQVEYTANNTRRSFFAKNDRLLPVITFVIHFSPDEWDGKTTLKELLKNTDPKLLPFISDYKMNLIDIAQLTENDFSKFHSETKQIFEFIKYSKNDDELQKILTTDDGFKTLSRDAAIVIKACTNLDLEIDKEEIDMCEAIKKIQDKAILKGREEGREEGFESGIIHGSRVEKYKTVERALKKNLDISIALSVAGLTEEEYEEMKNKYKDL